MVTYDIRDKVQSNEIVGLYKPYFLYMDIASPYDVINPAPLDRAIDDIIEDLSSVFYVIESSKRFLYAVSDELDDYISTDNFKIDGLEITPNVKKKLCKFPIGGHPFRMMLVWQEPKGKLDYSCERYESILKVYNSTVLSENIKVKYSDTLNDYDRIKVNTDNKKCENLVKDILTENLKIEMETEVADIETANRIDGEHLDILSKISAISGTQHCVKKLKEIFSSEISKHREEIKTVSKRDANIRLFMDIFRPMIDEQVSIILRISKRPEELDTAVEQIATNLLSKGISEKAVSNIKHLIKEELGGLVNANEF